MEFINIKSNIFPINRIEFIGKSERVKYKNHKDVSVYMIVVYTIENSRPFFIDFKYKTERDQFFADVLKKLDEC